MSAADEIKLPLTSVDVNAERLAQLRQLYPEAFTEGKIDFPKLRQLFDEVATEAAEHYGLSWSGKSEAIKNIQTLTSGTLLPARDESVNFDATENLIIEGDNLEVLKLLQGGYHGRVKMIYIDPPYNTGGDFIYPDNYKEGLADYLKFSGQVSGEGVKLTTNPETDGRYHSKWLTMIYPRLFLARNLLREDGVIFVSIDDHEVHNLRAVMNEIFGEENLLAELVWKNKYNSGALTKGFSNIHEYLLCYSRNPVENITVPLTDDLIAEYKGKDSKFATRGGFVTQPLATGSKDPRPNLRYPITWKGKEIWPDKQWIWSKERVDQAMANDEIVVNESDGKPGVRVKQYLKDENGQIRKMKPLSLLIGPFNQEGSKETEALLGDGVFGFPKPSSLIRYLLSLAINNTDGRDDIVLDFFAGSGTTAQAVLELNAQDGGNRKFILVQLPEPTERKDFPTIADITKERVRRVIKKLETESTAKNAEIAKKLEGQLPLTERGCVADQPQHGGKHGDAGSSSSVVVGEAAAAGAPAHSRAPDLGFKAFKLSSSNFKVWDAASAPKDAAGLAEQLKLMAHNVVENRGDEALLYELVLKSNLPLTGKITSGTIGSQTFYDVADGALAICLERKITQETLRGIIERKPRGVICLDIAFAGNDQLKTNIVLEMKSHGIEFHTA